MYVLLFLPYQILEELFTPMLFSIQHRLLVIARVSSPKKDVKYHKSSPYNSYIISKVIQYSVEVTVFQQCYNKPDM